MNILTVNWGCHDGSVTILKDGEIHSFFLEERFSGTKYDGDPIIALQRCISGFNERIDHCFVTSYPDATTSKSLPILNKLLDDYPKFIDVSSLHHRSHASLAFYNSGFEESLVIVVDGQGSLNFDFYAENETVYYMKYPNKINCIIKNISKSRDYFRNFHPTFHDNPEVLNKIKGDGGVVSVYNTATRLAGLNVLLNGKTMGLSSYGKKSNEYSLFDSNGHPKWELFTDENNADRLYKEHVGKSLDGLPITEENYQFFANYAHEVQDQTQTVVGNLIESALKKVPCKNVCVVGGYGMNVVANYYYTQRFPDVNFYFEPNSDDGGLSIGIAKMIHHDITKDCTIRPLKNLFYHGIRYDVTCYRGKTTKIKEIAKLLYDNKSVAVYKGLAEGGRRAYGNRSILFNPLNKNAKNIVNQIKKREWYRPFAAAVLEEDANTYFEMGNTKSSPFMTICFPVREKYRKILPGITHVDNTCRIQTVSRNDGYLYELLLEFRKLSGHGIILNTSFNLAGNSLVETPDQAFITLKKSNLDYLWFEETCQLFQ